MSTVKKEINSELHTLYSEIIEEKKQPIDKSKNLYEVKPKHKLNRLYIGRFFEKKRGLHSVFNELKSAKEHDELEFIINSGGGFINEGMQFYNLIEEKFSGRTTTYLDNSGYSMGALLFCMGSKRVIYPYSDFMFHTYSTVIGGKGSDLKARFKHSDKKIKRFFKDIIVKQNFLSKEEFQKMLLGQDFWMDAKELCKRGIATHVIYQGKELTSKEYLKLLKKKSKSKKS